MMKGFFTTVDQLGTIPTVLQALLRPSLSFSHALLV